MFSFGDFKTHEIADLINDKDPLGLYSDIDEGNQSSNITNNQVNKEIPSNDEAMMLGESNMAHNVIPHYLRAGNCNNSANANKEDEGTPTLQVNSKSRPIRSISSGNLAKKMSFRSFEDIQQSLRDLALTLTRPRKRTRTTIQACLKTQFFHLIHQILRKLCNNSMKKLRK